MIRSLYIQNYALIEQLDITFENGFSVITGETGAGKSIMLGALALLLGQRADSKAIRQGAAKCVIEARFDLANVPIQQFFFDNALDFDADCILRREVYASGKSRAFINDTPVQLSQMKALGDQLIDIHSQHQNLLLNHEGFQLDVLDLLAHHHADLKKYRQLFKEWTETKRKLQLAKEEAERNKADEDYIRFQLTQLHEANLKVDEQEMLEQEAEMLSHSEDIKSALYKSVLLLDGDGQGILQKLKECCLSLKHIIKYFPDGAVWTERLDSSYIELKDIADEISAQEDKVEFNPERVDEVAERLNTIYSLQKKHHVDSIAQLLEIEADFQQRLDNITSSDGEIASLQQHCDRCKCDLLKLAEMLTKKRIEAGKQMENHMQDSLVPLGMPHVRFQVKIVPRQEPDIDGMDSVSFLFSANKNGILQDISAVASGGEIARVMLSIKAMLAGETLFSTIIFDEIDTGVSGEIAARMASMMESMALGINDKQQEGRQVISITHLPQIAAKGKIHYKVYKRDNEHETVSQIRRLTPEERVEEIAHMLSGDSLTKAAIQNAKELLKIRS